MIPPIARLQIYPQSRHGNLHARRGWCAFLISLLFGALTILTRVTTRAQDAQGIRTLEPDRPVERELASGESHAYQFTIRAGQYLEITIAQHGIDVVVTLAGPDGKRIAQFDNDSRAQGQEMVTRVIEAAGDYRLTVASSRKDAAAGRYVIRQAAPHAATAQERALQDAPQLSVEATRITAAARLDELLQQAERALAVRTQAFGAEHPEVATALDRLASIIRNKGDLAKAEPLFQRALTIAEKTPSPGHAELGQILNDLGTLYLRKGDLIQAEARFQRALEVWQQTLGPDHSNVARALTNLGAIYANRGDRAKAETMFRRALESRERTLGTEHPDLINTLINLGNIYYGDGDYERAEAHYQRVLRIVEKTPGQETPVMAGALNNLASIYQDYKREFAQAEKIHRRVQAIREKVFGTEHPEVAQTINNLGSLFVNQGDYAKAEPLHQRALAMREKTLGPDHYLIASTLDDLARLYAAEGNFNQAINNLSRAATITERNIAVNIAVGSEREKLAYLSTAVKETDRTISLHARFAPGSPAARRLALTTLLQRKGRALDAMTDSIAGLRRRAAPQDQALLDQLKTVRAQIARLVLSGPQRMTPAEHQSRIETFEDQREKLEDQISRESAEFRAQSQPITLAAVQAAIPARAALVEFAAYRPFNPKFTRLDEEFGAPRYVAYILGWQGEARWVELGAKQPIDEAIGKLRQALRDRKRRDYKKLARDVDRLVMQPIRPLLGQTRRILVAPDGNINLIPFAALVDQNNRFLLERYTFSYLTSGRDLLRLQVKQPSKQSALIVANPDFGEDTKNAPASERILRYKSGTQATDGKVTVITQAYFPALPGTAGEAQALKGLLTGARVFVKDQATEAMIKQASSPSILHVATHGFFLPDAPATAADGRRAGPTVDAQQPVENPLLRSGLALAGANQLKSGPAAEEDGILTALEAADLDLWGTKLVVLSACQTGIGDVKDGEGVYGLRRALVLAGSESQVMSLWSVSDLATRNLMIEYYRRLQRGEGRTEALRQVQLGFLRRLTRGAAGQGAAADYSHPYYWACFIQSGEWAPLEP